ncbi:MAG TPA: SgcJ/EcaC family oxidoreductase [Lautropia sp.]|nr:SgcJ/EcaC family oxidoreductase [Lautropia sp.]
MSDHPLKSLIEAADRAITAQDYESLMGFYAADATLVVRPGLNVSGHEQIRRAFIAIGEHFQHTLSVSQGKMVVIEGGDTALVLMETLLEHAGPDGSRVSTRRAATYVFRKEADGRWLCVVDNSYGTDLLIAEPDLA